MWTSWLVIAGLFMISEFSTKRLLFAFFALGALVSSITSLIIPDRVISQVVIFAVSTGILLALKPRIVAMFTANTSMKQKNE